MYENIIKLPTDDFYLEGNLTIPVKAKSLIIFLSGFGNRFDPVHRILANHLQEAGYATLLFDLLTTKERENPRALDVETLSRRIVTISSWLHNHSEYRLFELGYLGISSGVPPALIAAAEPGTKIKAIVSIGGRTDWAKKQLPEIASPTLLIAPEYDFHTIKLNQEALDLLNGPKNMVVIPGTSHFFAEAEKLDHVADISVNWFRKYLPTGVRREAILKITN